MPLYYLPSRDFRPQWGYDKQPIPQLDAWFEESSGQYREFLEFMGSLDVSGIRVQMRQAESSAPAWLGGAISAFDSLALYAMVVKNRPAVFLEIGSGMTTCFARQAITDAHLNSRIVSIDPQPRRENDKICDEVIREGLEVCDLAVFDRLEAGDIVFLDGSHRSFMNSDVTVFFIDVLPMLRPGVIVHIHDILLPWDYPDSFKHWY